MRHARTFAFGATATLALAMAAPATAQDFFLGQFIEVGNGFCPRFFLETNGQILAISTNTALFSLLGTTYGGNGVTTFALPDLRGRMAISVGQGPGLAPYNLGQVGGAESTTIGISNLLAHIHSGAIETAPAAANERRSFRNAFSVTADNQYATGTNLDLTMHSETITVQKAGGTETTVAPTMSPFIVTRMCIATSGIFPSRN
ncbi:phage tail protein [Sphingopyxis sp. PET50]|uniref:phage tail protein n=1 Tax=Sphingopyxis sp. PET50 TaxID=2976533 RepID=UPI0021B02B5A|nr:tail fiber protein [Sphingopyxis sp. PET50]